MISTLGSRALIIVRKKVSDTTKTCPCEKWLPILWKWRSEWLFYRQAEFQISISIVFWKTLAGVNSTSNRVGLNLLHPTAYLAPIYTSHFYDEDETHLFLLFWWCVVVVRSSNSWIRFSSVGTFLDSNSKSWTFFKLEANNSRVVCNSSTRLRL